LQKRGVHVYINMDDKYTKNRASTIKMDYIYTDTKYKYTIANHK
jgi:hypothetical protein